MLLVDVHKRSQSQGSPRTVATPTRELGDAIEFGTKAETLERLRPLLLRSRVLDLLWFTVKEWRNERERLIHEIGQRFGSQPVVVRSSARNEDGDAQSQAGAFASCLDVDSAAPVALASAVRTVIDSFDGDPENQVLIQPMLKGITLSGVIMTHELDTGAPYYVLNYDDESGRADTITSGSGENKTVLVHRDCAGDHMDSPRVAELIGFVRELETLCGPDVPLDIEFAKTADAQLYLLQVRRITVQKNWNRHINRQVGNALEQAGRFLAAHSLPRPHLAGSRSILGQMPDWNPAEIIGTHPRPLAISLYRHLITDSVWQEARVKMGYQPVPHTPLMITFGGQPYIDVRASFNSFLPAGLPAKTRHQLVNAWLDRLEQHPEFHDKVEFEVAQTIVDFNFDTDHQARYAGALSSHAFHEYRERLARLTRRNLELNPGSSLPEALVQIGRLEKLQSLRRDQLRQQPDTGLLSVLLDECRQLGTEPFSIIARHAFIAETLLRSAVARNVLEPTRLEEFKHSLHTVTTDFTGDFADALEDPSHRGEFLERYGHLRPGTYDIISLRYDQRRDLFNAPATDPGQTDKPSFELTRAEAGGLRQLFGTAGLGTVEPGKFLQYARLAIANRERAKFIFTRHLSDALEMVAHWGADLGMNREALSHLTVRDLLDQQSMPVLKNPARHFRALAERNRRDNESMSGIRLGYLIRDRRDIFVVPLHRSTPNFVTSSRIEGAPLRLDNHTQGGQNLARRIVCIENADPGFDWIFTRDIAGLVSQYGGANSHMTIRCAELGLPAAIGVGGQTFERIAGADLVELDAGARIIRPIYG
jgi:hypothetical protein